MFQTWSYTGSHIEAEAKPRHVLTLALVSTLMPCLRHGLTLVHI
ncbi:hypothetical protein F383_17574 [Gossypium arboreum]|uniref:Uncharacterized protein n=1 Tax=Gossypium arboreum TaxID=29729 RepID=A0A0B0NGX2_GOSAR|nr:hypothetical protein F383_17574 [Gossypium arboreum]